jgi:hypothetical protein
MHLNYSQVSPCRGLTKGLFSAQISLATSLRESYVQIEDAVLAVQVYVVSRESLEGALGCGTDVGWTAIKVPRAGTGV